MRILLWIGLMILNCFALQVDQKQQLENYIRNQLLHQTYLSDVKCGTQYDLMIHSHQDQIESDLYQRYLSEVKKQPEWERSMVTNSGYFSLHWMESGINAVPLEDISGNGYPDYIDSAAVIFDMVRDIEVNQMNYAPPPAQDGTPVIPYPVYFLALGDYGVTVPSYIDIPNLPGTNYTSYIKLDNNYSDYFFPTKGLDALRITAAHEFHHAIQLGYNFRSEDLYFMEMTSTWMEEVIFPDINDYFNYLPSLFNNVSNTRFDLSFGTYRYGNSVYLQMLESEHGSEIVKSIWDRILVEPSLNALKYTLEENNDSWVESLGEYGLWLYYTADRSQPGKFFSDAAHFPKVRINAMDKFVFENNFTEDVSIEAVSNRYLEFYYVRGKILETKVSVGDSPLAGFRNLTPYSYSIFRPLNQPIIGEPVDSDTMTIILTNSEYEYLSTNINISQSGEIDLTSIYPFPSPVNININETINFQNVPPEADLYIFNTRGRRVSVIQNQGRSYVRSWNLNNEMGEQVAAGVYMYLVQGEGLFKTGKFSIIR